MTVDPELFRSHGIDPVYCKIVVVKSPNGFRSAYGPIARAMFVVDTPGVSTANLKTLPFRRFPAPFIHSIPILLDRRSLNCGPTRPFVSQSSCWHYSSMVCYTDRVCLAVAGPDISKSFGLDQAQMGMVYSIFSLSYFIGQTPWGMLADRRAQGGWSASQSRAGRPSPLSPRPRGASGHCC